VIETMTQKQVADLGARRRTSGVVRTWLRDPGGKATAGLVALAVGFIFWQIFKWGGPDRQTLISDVAFLPVSLAGAVLAWRAAGIEDIDRQTRRAWRIIALAFLLYWIGDVLWTLEENLGSAPYPSVADVAYLGFYVSLLWGVLSFPTAPRTRADKAKLWLDTGTVMLGAFMILWYYALGPTVRSTGAGALEASVSLAYPIGDLVLVLAIARILLARPPRGLGHSLGILATGLLIFVIADVAFAALSLKDAYNGGDWPDSLWMVSQVLMAIAAQYQYWYRTQREVADAGEVIKIKPFSPLPYVAVFGSFGLLAVVGWHEAAYPLGGLMLGAIGVTTLVVLRQITALRENLSLLTELHELASTDMLTGLQSRRHFFEIAEREFYLARRHNRPLAAMMIDIDHFKGINDTYGHAAGDVALQRLALTIREHLRGTDVVGRYGGDELVTILPNTDVESALEAAGRIRRALQDLAVESDGGPFSFTVSVGVATAEAAADLAQLLRRADRALYQAKQDGRNRTHAISA
jgi:diguanylate cyclase (GGDEF)-like protein